MPVHFEWDGKKAKLNFKKHKVDFEEAKTVFGDRLANIFFDKEHSIAESREIIVGHSHRGRLLLVNFTEREPEIVRIISARLVTNYERKDYEETQKI